MSRGALGSAVVTVIAAVSVGVLLSAGVHRVPTGALSASSSSRAAAAAAAAPAVALQQVAGAFSQPLGVTALPGDAHRIFVVEKTGAIRVVQDGVLLPTPFLDISSLVSAGSEQGLLSLAFDPGYVSNGFFYVDYTNTAGDTRVVRYHVSPADPNVADPTSATVMLAIPQPFPNHNGGQLAFGPDGLLYIGMGDGGGSGDPSNNGQNRRVLLGKILRMNVHAAAPKPSIYALGLRNPWRFSFDARTGALWIGDVGQNRWEEIDYLAPGRAAGANLGWSAYEGSHVFKPAVAAKLSRGQLVWPVAQYSHAVGNAVIGGSVYRGSAIPALRGWYVFGDLASGHIWAMHGPKGKPLPVPGADRQLRLITSFGADGSGELYVTTLGGGVYKIVHPVLKVTTPAG